MCRLDGLIWSFPQIIVVMQAEVNTWAVMVKQAKAIIINWGKRKERVLTTTAEFIKREIQRVSKGKRQTGNRQRQRDYI